LIIKKTKVRKHTRKKRSGKVSIVKQHVRKVGEKNIGSTKLVIKDPPIIDFLKHNINAEREAIEEYTHESDRTDDPIMKEVFHDIAVEEMEHLHLLEHIKENIEKEKKND
jgi:rubrerythrin